MNRYSGIGLTTLESKCGLFKVRSVYTVQAKGVDLITPKLNPHRHLFRKRKNIDNSPSDRKLTRRFYLAFSLK